MIYKIRDVNLYGPQINDQSCQLCYLKDNEDMERRATRWTASIFCILLVILRHILISLIVPYSDIYDSIKQEERRWLSGPLSRMGRGIVLDGNIRTIVTKVSGPTK